jgi:hypothetical protein
MQKNNTDNLIINTKNKFSLLIESDEDNDNDNNKINLKKSINEKKINKNNTEYKTFENSNKEFNSVKNNTNDSYKKFELFTTKNNFKKNNAINPYQNILSDNNSEGTHFSDFTSIKKKETNMRNFSEKKIIEDIYDLSNIESGEQHFLASQWYVWVHRSDCPKWTVDTYKNIFIIKNIKTFWEFFNNFHILDKIQNQFFIMRNKIKPIYEDNENRNGGRCSIKIDSQSKFGKMDIGSEVMISLSLLIMNETLVPKDIEINGIEYSIRNRSVLIKIWYKDFKKNIEEKLPISFFNKLDGILKLLTKPQYGNKKNEKLYNIQCSEIKPEYSII